MDYREKLNKIVRKDLMELTHADKAFLKARRVYLTGKQQTKFASVLNAKLRGPKEIMVTGFKSYKETQRRAKELGIPFYGVKKAELEVAISTIEGPEGSLKPE